MCKKLLLVAMIAMLFFAVQAGKASAGLVVNGGFTQGADGFAGWSLGGDTSWVFVNTDSAALTPGGSYASIGSNAGISQTISTVAGQVYSVSFSLANSVGDSSGFQALWDGVVKITLPNVPSLAWTPYAYTATGSGSDTLSFSFQQPGQGVFSFTNVAAAPTPLPGALLLFGPGLVGLAAVRKRFHK